MSVRIITGDCREQMALLPEASVDAIVCDPPYELTAARPGGRSEATRGKVMGGFMGMKWDGTGVAFDIETWRQALRVLKPGGHLLAFSGTRTYHRMVCAIEDAGFEVRDQIGWLYGSGFPKSHNGEWGGTALKPAWEPIVLARKPLIGTVEANWREHGTGALNIEVCRVGTESTRRAMNRIRVHSGADGAYVGLVGERPCDEGLVGGSDSGRWPANVIHDGSDEVVAAFPHTESGKQAAGGHIRNTDKSRNAFGAFAGQRVEGDVLYGDSGSAARFFYTAKASRFDRNDGLEDPGPQFKKGSTLRDAENIGSKRRGNHHPTVKPTDLMRYLCRLVTPPGGTVLDPFAGSGSTLKASELEGFSAIGIELDPAYVEIARRRIASDAPLFSQVDAA